MGFIEFSFIITKTAFYKNKTPRIGRTFHHVVNAEFEKN